MCVGGETQVFRAAFSNCFSQQVAPGVVGVAVAPVFGLVLQHFGRAIGPGILRRGHPIQPIIGEGLVAVGFFVIGDAIDVAVVAVAEMEVIADGKYNAVFSGGKEIGTFRPSRLSRLFPIFMFHFLREYLVKALLYF